MDSKILIAPSLLAADFSDLRAEVRKVETAGADALHLDVMDGVFVPNISFGFPVIDALRKLTALPFDVHLMIDRPERYCERFVRAGADVVTFHYEATADPAGLLKQLRSLGVKASVSIKPDTDEQVLFKLLPLCDMVLIMTVEPGFGGQRFIEKTLKKIKNIRAEIEKNHYETRVEVDGGINEETARLACAAGADVLVAGSSFFRAADPASAVAALRGA